MLTDQGGPNCYEVIGQKKCCHGPDFIRVNIPNYDSKTEFMHVEFGAPTDATYGTFACCAGCGKVDEGLAKLNSDMVKIYGEYEGRDYATMCVIDGFKTCEDCKGKCETCGTKCS
jgi:hypothetical protein